MSNPDQIQRVLFDNADIRCVVAGVETAYQEVIQRHGYPQVIQKVLGEMMAAVSLLSATLKFEGRLSLQAQGNNNVKALMAECNHQRDLRAIARFDGELPEQAELKELIGDGQLVITIEPENGKRYQGVVPLEGDRLSQCLEDYFSRSEQLPTQIHLATGEDKAAGFLIQVMPVEGGREDQWEHFSQLAATLSDDELLGLDNETILRRLFHEEECRLYEPEYLRFNCDCTRERTGHALQYLTQEELEEIIREEGKIEVNCQFCNENYQFDQADVVQMFSITANVKPSDQVH